MSDEVVLASNQLGWPEFSIDQKPPLGVVTKNTWCVLNSVNSPLAGVIKTDESDVRYWSVPGSTYKTLVIGNLVTVAASTPMVLYLDADLAGETGLLVSGVSIPGSTGRQITRVEFTPTSSMSNLRITHATGIPSTVKFYGARLAAAPADDYGVFSGATVLDGMAGRWTGEAYNSISELIEVAPPGPDDPTGELASRVMALLRLDKSDPDDVSTATESVNLIRLMVRAYTRGNGFTVDPDNGVETIVNDLEAVIVTAAVRYLANPTGLTYRAGSESVTSAFAGWTLAETYVLNAYRKRAS